MRWQGKRESGNVEDRRRSSGVGGGGLPIRGGTSLIVLLVVLAAGYYGIDLSPLLSGGGPAPSAVEAPYSASPEEDEMARFTSVSLALTEDVWGALFQRAGQSYAPPKLVLFSGSTSTTCGYGQSAMGPFYCPADQTVYIDLSFYQDMKDNLGGGGDFALGYVIAHEVGHHVQYLLGIEKEIRARQRGLSQREANRLSVAMELQADCFAGVWGHYVESEGLLEAGDLAEALNTASAIGDDRLQRQSGGAVTPDSFTHGTSRERYDWFKRGYDSGNPDACAALTAN